MAPCRLAEWHYRGRVAVNASLRHDGCMEAAMAEEEKREDDEEEDERRPVLLRDLRRGMSAGVRFGRGARRVLVRPVAVAGA